MMGAGGTVGAMFDVRSLFIVMVVTNLVLAASLWIGTGRKLRDGLGQWTGALVAQAVAFGLLATRGGAPDAVAAIAANAFLALGIALVAGAILGIRGRRLPAMTYVVVVLIAQLLIGSMFDNWTLHVVTTSTLFGAAMLLNLVLAWRPVPGVAPATHWLFACSMAASATVLLSRAVAALAYPEAVESFATPSMFQAAGLLVVYTVTLTSSVAFLLMQKERADHRAQQLASIDPLTGAYNRRTFMELAAKELSRARRLDNPVSLVLLDLDHFKRVNDTYGHLAGDGALRAFADIVRTQLRKEDIFVRYGGEEFCLLLPDVPGTGAVALAGRIRLAVEQETLNIGGHQISLTISAGVSSRIDENPEDLDRLIARADEALYLAKNRGRNRVAAVSLGQSKLA